MAQLVGDMSQDVMGNFTIQPQNASGAVTGTGVPTTTIGGDVLTLRFALGAASGLTTVTCAAECSADGTTWVAASGVGGVAPVVTLTLANTAGAVAFFPGNGGVSQYVRGNITTFTATTGNITAVIEGQLRIGSSGAYQNTPPSGST